MTTCGAQTRPLGSAEWTKVGTGSPAAITVNENRWPTLAVADDTLLKVGACRPAAAGVVVGGAVVVGGVSNTSRCLCRLLVPLRIALTCLDR